MTRLMIGRHFLPGGCARGWAQFIGSALAGLFCLLPAVRAVAQSVGTVTQVATGAEGRYDTNSCAIDHNNLISQNFTSSGVQDSDQYIAFYNSSDHIELGRRTFNSSTGTWGNWTVDSTTSGGFNGANTYTISDASDDHNVIAMGIDPSGDLHMSWDMHNVTLNYAISTTSVTGSAFGSGGSLTLTKQTSTGAPTLFPSGSSTTNEVTYPEFYNVPGTGQLIFAYRNGGAGGGSGNGNQYVDAYNATAKTWTNNFMINGEATSVNAYLNGFVYDSNGNLLSTWTYRATPNWQTNSNIMFAQSPDNGVTWYPQGGATPYTLPIEQTSPPGTANQVAQIIENIPQGDSFINQTSMTVDNFNRPMAATYLAPGWTATSSTSGSGNPNRQYMLFYYTGSAWKSSQITNRTSDTAVDFSGNDVRDLGRPIVLVDKQDRVLVVTRSEDTSMGSFTNSSVKNNIVVYYSTNLYTAATPTWTAVTLDGASMGNYEPTYDQNMWNTYGILDLFYEPSGLSGETSSPVSVLDWNEEQFFAVKGDVNDDGTVTGADLQAMLAALKNEPAYEAANGLTGPDLIKLGDVNVDGKFDASDVLAMEKLLATGASGGPSTSAVPEPPSAELAALAFLCCGTFMVSRCLTKRKKYADG
jgi:hypothetical protein